MRRRKKENWLISLYKNNKLYVWVIVGIIVFSGMSIGIAIGKKDIGKVALVEDSTVLPNRLGESKSTNTVPIKETNNKEESNKNHNSKVIAENEKSIVNNKILEENKEDKKNEEIKVLKFILPVEGEIYRDFSKDTLVYSNTLEQWINHTGIDIIGENAMPVKSIEDGIVTEIKQDPRYGYTIVIDHGQGYKSIYCNLSTLDMVFINKNVEKGQVISGIGNTALFESKDKEHLHFELIKDEECVNPLDYIKI